MTAVWDDSGVEHDADLQVVDLVGLLMHLDGDTRTMVTVLTGEGHAACGGDARAGVVMYVTFDGDHFHQLVRDRSDDEGEQWVVAGGQAGTYPSHCVVSVEDAATALTWYVERGELLPTGTWESS